MKEPTVSIVIPTYRRLEYLREALPSALRQTYRDFEIIVSDDSASDEIAAYSASLGDARIRYRRNEKRLGIALNHYAAFSEARGKYIASLHDDDFWEPLFLATLVPPLEADDSVTVAFCDHHLIDGQGRFLRRYTEFNTRRYRRKVLAPGRHQPFLGPAVADNTIPLAMAAVFRKSILHDAEYPPRIGGSYDHWIAYLALKDGQACYYVPQRLTRYRIHPASGTVRGGLAYWRDAIYVRQRFLREPKLRADHASLKNGLGIVYGKMALYYLSRGSFKRGKLFWRHAFGLIGSLRSRLALIVKTFYVFCLPPKR